MRERRAPKPRVAAGKSARSDHTTPKCPWQPSTLGKSGEPHPLMSPLMGVNFVTGITSGRARKLLALLVLALVAAIALAGCSSDDDGGGDRSQHLDRSLQGMLSWPMLEDVVIISKPNYDDDFQKNVLSETSPMRAFSGSIEKVLKGSSPEEGVITFVVSGRNSELPARAETGISSVATTSAALEASERVVLGGAFYPLEDGSAYFDPAFIYSLEDGELTSLLESSSSQRYPTFKLAELVAALGG